MSLEVAIEKRRPGFHLDVKFTAERAPLGLLGPSGSGKSMTLRAIAGLDAPDRGRIVLHGRVLFDSEKGINLPARERRVGLLFQNYALFPHLTVAENIAFGLRHLPAQDRERRAAQQISRAHLDGLASRYPATLSGGEQQRVALARALAIEPAALLLDEPFSALDTHLRGTLERQLLKTLNDYAGSTVFVSHNLEEAYRVCDQIVVLSNGSVAASGPKEKIFRYPPTREVARLTGCKNFSRARRDAHGLIEAADWSCLLRVSQDFSKQPGHIAIRAHHVRVHPPGDAEQGRENVFPCWLTSMTETPFRVTLDLKITGRIGNEAPTGTDYHVQAEVFKQEWEAFRYLPQPWSVELPPDRLILFSD